MNVLSYLLIRKDKKALIISYDQFCQKPEQFLQQINDKTGVTISIENYLKEISQTDYHTINGNIAKFQNIDKIFYKLKWKENFNWFDKMLTTIICFPFNRFFVYRNWQR